MYIYAFFLLIHPAFGDRPYNKSEEVSTTKPIKYLAEAQQITQNLKVERGSRATLMGFTLLRRERVARALTPDGDKK